MKHTTLVVVIAFAAMLWSCSPSREKMQSRIAGMEEEMKQMHPMDTVKVTELIGAYQAYAHKFPQDSLAPEYLFKAAGLALGCDRSQQALDLYKSIRNDYPAFRKAPDCLFLQGFIFENYIKDLSQANLIYNQFIAKYPNNELTDDAVNAIKYLGKPLDEVIKDFEAQNANADSLKTATR